VWHVRFSFLGSASLAAATLTRLSLVAWGKHARGPGPTTGGAPGRAAPGGSPWRGPAPGRWPVADPAGPPPAACADRYRRRGCHAGGPGGYGSAEQCRSFRCPRLRTGALRERAVAIGGQTQPGRPEASGDGTADGARVCCAGREYGCSAAYPAAEGAGAKASVAPSASAPAPAPEPIETGEARADPRSAGSISPPSR
jgi:hypothetical protein